MSEPLTGQSPANTYKDLLRVDGDNTGVLTTGLRQIVAGNGSVTSIWVAQDQTAIDFGEGTATKPVLKSARHTFYEPTENVSTFNLTIDLNAGNVQRYILGTNISNLIFNDLPADGDAFELTLIFTQDSSGGRTLSWPSSIKWPAASAPTIASGADRTSIYRFITFDGGTSWYGSTYGQDYH
jgi:hypothetical protein